MFMMMKIKHLKQKFIDDENDYSMCIMMNIKHLEKIQAKSRRSN